MKRDGLWLRMLAFLAVLLLAFAACGEDEEPEPQGGGNGDNGGASEEIKLVEDGVLTVGSDIPYPPFEFEDEGGALSGFDVDVVRAVAERIGLQNEDTDWISTDFTTIFQQLQTGNKFDIVVAAVTGYAPDGSPAAEVVAERTSLIDFTLPYYPSLQSLAVNTNETPDVAGHEDLEDGARVAVQAGTTGAFYAQENLAPRLELVEFPKAPGMYQALLAGQVAGVFSDLPVAIDEVKNKEGLEVVQQVETGEEYAIAVAKDNTALKDAIDAALEEIYTDGTYVEIFEKYFPDQELPDYAQG